MRTVEYIEGYASGWSVVTPTILEDALTLCKGTYQRDIVKGYEAISGSTLKGEAKKWQSKYSISRENLLSRLETKFNVEVVRLRNNKGYNRIILVITP